MTRRPRIAPARDWSFPGHQEARLSTGLTVWAFHLPGQYVVSAALSLDLPLSLEPPEMEGIATIVAHTLDEGTLPHPGSELTARLEDLGAVFAASATLSGTQVGISVPVTELAPALPLLAEAVREPALAEADIVRQVGLRRAELVQVRASSAHLAAALTPASVFAPGSRASRPSGGSTTTVSRVTAEAAQAFHRQHYSPVAATLVLAGYFTCLDPLQLAEDAFGDWRADRPAPEHQPPAAAVPSQRLVARSSAVQADVRLLAFACDRLDPRWPALQVASVAMGGAFQSRLNTVLRERRGWTYGVHLTPYPLRGAGYLAFSGSFRTEVVAPAPELVVGDLSFISLTLVLEPLLRAAADDADLLLMVKPQFEVGKDRIGHGGVVRDPELHVETVMTVAEQAHFLGVGVEAVTASPLPGPAGNVEYFLSMHASRAGCPEDLSGDELRSSIEDAVAAGPAAGGARRRRTRTHP